MGLRRGGGGKGRGGGAPPLPGQAGEPLDPAGALRPSRPHAACRHPPHRGGSGPRGALCRADPGPGRAEAHPAGAGPPCGAAAEGCGGVLPHRAPGPPLQRPVRGGRGRSLLGREAQYRHPGHSSPLYPGGTGRLRCPPGHPGGRQAPRGDGLPPHRPAEPPEGAHRPGDGRPLPAPADGHPHRGRRHRRRDGGGSPGDGDPGLPPPHPGPGPLRPGYLRHAPLPGRAHGAQGLRRGRPRRAAAAGHRRRPV